MQTQKKLSDPNRWKFTGDTYFVASRKEMEEMFEHPMHKDFPKDKLKEALDNTVIIADMCNFELEVGKVYLPEVQIPIDDKEFIEYNNKVGGNVNQNYMRYLCEKRMKELDLYDKQEYRDRLEMEIKVIDSMNFTDYFIIYQDICRYCREANIPVGPGRGSGAGSLVNYLLRITKIDPLEYDLLFERFLNPDRLLSSWLVIINKKHSVNCLET